MSIILCCKNYRVEHELSVWCQHHSLQSLFADDELDIFIDDQQSARHAGVVVNPLQTEFAEPWEAFGGEIGRCYCVGH